MRIHFISAVFFITATLSAVSCKKAKDPSLLDSSLYGQWNVVQVSGVLKTNGVPGPTATDDSPTGYIRFDSNGWGEQNYSFTLLGTEYPNNSPFSWSATSTEIRIDRISEPDMVWTRQEASATRQVATYAIPISATQTIDYTLTLEK